MCHAIVLACGNRLRGDDGIAPHIADCLRAGFCDPSTEIHCSQQWLPELAEPLSRAELAIFVHASAALSPGEIRLQQLDPSEERPGSTTHFPPAHLLTLARDLYASIPQKAFLLTIGCEQFEHRNQISHAVLRAVPLALTQIKALIAGVSLPSGSVQHRAANR